MTQLMPTKYPGIFLLLLLTGTALAAEFKIQTNDEGSVTVKVTPVDVSPQAKSWDFTISLDTHTAALDQDMESVAVLIDGSGSEHKPVVWDGDPPGGHHREGVLRFAPLNVTPEVVELHINGIGGVSRRVFRWKRLE